MRKLYSITTALLICAALSAYAQQSVSIGTTTIDKDAVLFLLGDGTQGLIIPKTTDLLTMPKKAGMVVYNETDGKVYSCDGNSWTVLGGGVTSNPPVLQINGNDVSIFTGVTVPLAVTPPTNKGQILMWNGSSWTANTAADPANGDFLIWNGSRWQPSSNVLTNLKGTAPITVTVPAASATERDISIAAGGITNNLIATDAVNGNNIANGTITGADLAGNIAISTSGNIATTGTGTLSVAGTTTLSSLAGVGNRMVIADASGVITTSPLPVASTLTNLTSPNAAITISNGTNAVIGLAPVTINVANASNSQTGLLTSTDFTTFSNKLGTGTAAGGDLTGTYPNPTLAASGVTAGTYGTSISVPQLTVDAKGRITTASSVAIPTATTSITGLLTGTDFTNFNNKLGNALNNAQIFVGSSGNIATGVAMSGDATITNAGLLTIGTGAVTSTKILDATITDADINATGITTAGKVSGSAITSGTIGGSTAINTTGNVAVTGSGTLTIAGATTLGGTLGVTGIITLGNLSGAGTRMVVAGPTGVLSTQAIAGGGDLLSTNNLSDLANVTTARTNLGLGSLATLSTVGTAEISDGTIANVDILNVDASKITTGTLAVARGGTNSTATPTNGGVAFGNGTAYAFTAAGTSGQILQSNGAAAPTWINVPGPSGSAGGDLTGTYPNPTIATGAITSTKILDATITDADINASGITTAGKVSGSAITSGTVGGSTAINTTGSIATTGTLNTGAATVTGLTVSGTTTSFNGASLTWPSTNGSGSLTNDGSGVLTWVPSGGGGTVTSITKGAGLVAGAAITTTGTIAVDVGTGANQIPQLDGTGKLNTSVIPTSVDSNTSDDITTSTTASGDVTGTFPSLTIANNGTTGGNIITAINANGASTINGARINTAFGSQNISTTGTLSSGATTVTGLTVNGATTSINGASLTWPSTNAAGVLTNNGTGTLTWGAAGLSSALPSANIFVGSSGNVATGVAMTGDISITNAGLTSIANSANAGTNIITAINNGGATGSISDTRLATISTAGKVSGGAITSGTIGGTTVINSTGNITTTGTLNTGAATVSSLSIGGTTINWPANSPGVLTNNGTGTLSWGAAGWSTSGNTLAGGEKLGSINGNPLPFITNNVERMRIDASGNIGIGTVSPSATLQLSNATPRLTISSTASNTTNGAQLGELWFNDAVTTNPQSSIRVFRDGTVSSDAPTAMVFYTTPVGSVSSLERMRITQSGNIGIGNNTPTAKLDVAGSIKIADGTQGVGKVLTSDANGLATWQTPSGGGWGLTGNTGTSSSTNFIGTTDNVALRFKTNGQTSGLIDPLNSNVFFGYRAGEVTTGQQNIAIGTQAFLSNTTGTANVVIGTQAMESSTTTSNIVAVGSQSLRVNTGADNTAVGYSTLTSNTTGFQNSAFGNSALVNNLTGKTNTAIGWNGLFSNSTGDFNTSLGAAALTANTTGSNNVAVGVNALQTNTTGSNNTSVGTFSDVASNNLTNATAIGNKAYVAQSNSLVLGSINGVNSASSNTNVGIGTTTPQNLLHVNGTSTGLIQISNNAIGSTATDGLQLDVDNSGTAHIYNREAGMLVLGVGASVNQVAFITSGGQMGLNVAAPTATLDIGGTIKIADGTQGTGKVLTSDANGLASWATPSGSSLISNPGTRNLFAGSPVASALTTGIDNVFVGAFAGDANTSGSDNTFVGEGAGKTNATAGLATLVGWHAGNTGTSMQGNTLIGAQAGESTTGNQNTFVGEKTGLSTSSNENVMVGSYAGQINTSGNQLTLIGGYATVSTPTGIQNATAIGYRAQVAQSNTIVLGSISGVNSAASSVNVGIGTNTPAQALDVTGYIRVAAGSGSSNEGILLATPAAGTSLISAGGRATTNFIISQTNSAPMSFQTSGLERMRVDAAGNVGIGQTNPSQKLDVNGSINLGSATAELTSANTGTNINLAPVAYFHVTGATPTLNTSTANVTGVNRIGTGVYDITITGHDFTNLLTTGGYMVTGNVLGAANGQITFTNNGTLLRVLTWSGAGAATDKTFTVVIFKQ